MHRWDGAQSFPYVITLFSAPNYCDYYSNKSSVLILESGNVSIKQYDQVDHPYHLPDQIDVFSWSMPFVIDKVMGLFTNILSQAAGDDDTGEGALSKLGEDKKKKLGAMKGKIRTIARISRMFGTLRQESELIL